MHFLRSFAIGLASFGFAAIVATFIWVVTLQNSLFDRAAVKQTLQTSGIYGSLVPGLSAALQSNSSQQESQIFNNTAVGQAFSHTFEPQYVQTQTETVLDNAYDWLEGKRPALTFSVPIDERRTTFTNELTKAIEPAIAELPICTSPMQVDITEGDCRPADRSPADFAKLIAEQGVNESKFLAEPLTNETITQPRSEAGDQETSPLQHLPAYYQWSQWLLGALPVLALLCLGVIFGLSNNRLSSSAHLGRRVFFSSFVTFALALFILWLGSTNTLAGSNGRDAALTTIFMPVIQKLLLLLGTQLVLISGVVTALGLTAWIALTIIGRKHRQEQLPAAQPQQTPQQPNVPTPPKAE